MACVQTTQRLISLYVFEVNLIHAQYGLTELLSVCVYVAMRCNQTKQSIKFALANHWKIVCHAFLAMDFDFAGTMSIVRSNFIDSS